MTNLPPPLDSCGCCDNGSSENGAAAGSAHANRPGLPAIAYRIGVHGSFLQRMLARLPVEAIPDGPHAGARPLRALTTRASTDPVVALLDAWAASADVLTFYQERIANEGFLRTAVERRSVLELARAIGYELKPGVAASTYLAFTLETAPGAPTQADIPERTRVLSIPAQGQKPQTFETAEAIEARPEWNALRPRQGQPQDLPAGTKIVYLKGAATGLQPGDALLLVGAERISAPGSERWDFRFARTVTTDVEKDVTTVTWTQGLGERPVAPAEEPQVYALRLRADLFGHNAAEWDNLHPDIKCLYDTGGTASEWPGFAIQNDQLDLEGSFPKVVPGSWVALVRPNYIEIYRAEEVDFTSRTGFGLVGKVTRITPDSNEHLSTFGLRQTTVFAQSELLELAEEPLGRSLSGDQIPLDGRVAGLLPGRTLIFSGKRMRARASTALTLHSPDGLRSVPILRGDVLFVTAPSVAESGGTRWFLEDRNGFTGSLKVARQFLKLEPAEEQDPTVSEVAVLDHTAETQERTTLFLQEALQNLFDRTTLTIFANVSLATHGETVTEVLGSGDGTQTHQRFTLKKSPLTYVSAATPSGTATSLEVRVNGVRWDEVASFYDRPPTDKVYTVELNEDPQSSPTQNVATLSFGDGIHAARLPSGTENVTAVYRSGIGLAGEVGAGSLSLLQTRPLGVRSVTNPLPASGAADPEILDDARSNAPVTVLTLERIVSRRDFEDFTRAFAGIGKAQATALWNGEVNIVHITAATAKGEPLATGTSLYTHLRAAIDAARDPGIPVVLQGHTQAYFRLKARLLVDEGYIFEEVKAAVESLLLETFAFGPRSFGQPVTAAELIRSLQQVPGVVAADLDNLYRDGDPPSNPPLLAAVTARRSGNTYLPAEILVIHPFGLEITEMTA